MESENHKLLIKTEKNEELELNADQTLQNLFSSLIVQGTEQDQTNSSKYIMRLDKDTRQIKLISKDELVSGKVDLEELSHPYFDNNMKEKLINRQMKQIAEDSSNQNSQKVLDVNKNDKILLFSPHPDDEILGACGLLYNAFTEKIDTTVIYMTSGKSAGDANVRQLEATSGIKKLGGDSSNLFFTNFPFYDKPDRSLSEDDYNYARELIRKYQPNKLFICADVFDPNRTHKKCFDILMKVIKDEEFSTIEVFFYYSVWYWPEDYEFTHILPYDYETYKMKIYAMLEHRSQIETKFMGNDTRPFYQRACARDTSYGKQFNHDYCEVYFLLNR